MMAAATNGSSQRTPVPWMSWLFTLASCAPVKEPKNPRDRYGNRKKANSARTPPHDAMINPTFCWTICEDSNEAGGVRLWEIRCTVGALLNSDGGGCTIGCRSPPTTSLVPPVSAKAGLGGGTTLADV